MNNNQQHDNLPEPLHFLLFSASLRKDSMNTRLIKLAANIIEKNNGKVDLANMSEFDSPSFNEDLERKGTIPAVQMNSGNDFC